MYTIVPIWELPPKKSLYLILLFSKFSLEIACDKHVYMDIKYRVSTYKSALFVLQHKYDLFSFTEVYILHALQNKRVALN